MKIEFMTRAMIEDCILNSKIFRDGVIDQLVGPASSPVHSEVLRVMRETCGLSNKIAFIKGIREVSNGRTIDFAKAYPLIISINGYNEKSTCLDLRDAKNLAESYVAKYPSYDY